jgi:hypothetical protein
MLCYILKAEIMTVISVYNTYIGDDYKFFKSGAHISLPGDPLYQLTNKLYRVISKDIPDCFDL